jgi:hypothetical protein
VAFPEWFVGPPIVGASSQAYVVYEATTAAQAAKYVSDGYKGPYATQAAAEAQAQARQSAAESTEVNLPSAGSLLGTLAGFLGVKGPISGTNLVIRAVKVIIGGLLLIIGLVHITGIEGAAADTARRVPLPV